MRVSEMAVSEMAVSEMAVSEMAVSEMKVLLRAIRLYVDNRRVIVVFQGNPKCFLKPATNHRKDYTG